MMGGKNHHSYLPACVFVLSLWAGRPAGAGECIDFPEPRCTEPCPAEHACVTDDDCSEDEVCHNGARLPSYCACHIDGLWNCSDDLVGECAPRPVPTGPRGYTIIDLGTLGGWTGVAHGINNFGQVVGEADTPDGRRHAFLWRAGVMRDLGILPLPNHRSSTALGINNRAQVVGNSSIPWTASRAFIWQNGRLTDLGDLGGYDTWGRAINDRGQIVGQSYVPFFSAQHSFLWEDGVMTDLIATIGAGAVDINNLGQLASSTRGELGPHAALWDGNAVVDLGTLGGHFSYSTALNDLGQVIGQSERAPGGDRVFTAFLWDNGVMLDLAELGGFLGARAEAINNCGEVVGGGGFPFLVGGDEGFRDLSTLIPGEDDWWDLDPRGINDRGQIVGAGRFQPGPRVPRPFLMTPIPGDLTLEGSVDLADYDLFYPRMTGPRAPDIPGCERADLDNDADVDLFDFSIFQQEFHPR